MIRGLGVDLVEVARMEGLLERRGRRARRRLFTEAEREGGRDHPRPAEYYAARFAAKEAFLKALGTGRSAGIRWTELEVRQEDGGNPWLAARGEARRRLERLGAGRAHVSLSHDGGHAVAVVVLED